MKICTKCKIEKLESEFNRNKQQKCGLHPSCKVCKAKLDKVYREVNKVKLSLQRKKKLLNRTDEQIKIDSEKGKAYWKIRPNQPVLKDKISKEQVALNKKNYDKRYWASEIGRMNARLHKQRRRAQKLSTDDNTITAQSLEKLKTTQDWKCYHCGIDLDFSTKGAVHLDHYIPLAKGGIHSITNVVWSCAKCNLKKSDSILEMPMQIDS